MRNKNYLFFSKYTIILFLGMVLIQSCKHDNEELIILPPEATPCENFRPVIMVHGFLGSGDTYTNQFLRFGSNGCDESKLFVFDWNSLGNDDNEALLDAFIDEVLQTTGADQIDLAGHSAGGGLGWSYIADSVRVAKVAHYVHLGSFPADSLPAAAKALPVLNIYSVDDTVVEGADIPGAENLQQAGYDHYEVATNEETFEAMFKHFRDEASPDYTTIQESSALKISGKALTLGENTPEVDAVIEIYALDSATGFRKQNAPDFSFLVDAEGKWGPFDAAANTHYEFYIQPANPDARPIHYYREDFKRSNQLVYLRTFPPADAGVVGFLSVLLPADDAQAVYAVFTSSQAVIAGRDNLSVGGSELSTDDLASADQSSIAFFLYDDNGDGNTSLEKNALLAGFPFLNGADMFFAAEPVTSVPFRFNDRVINVPTWKSATEGVSVVVFD